ncbi:MAG: sigma-54 dependent transcriptional regulator [Acidobacteriota bacterium]
MTDEDRSDWRSLETVTASELADGALRAGVIPVPGLTVLCHPDPDRVGEQAALIGLRREGEALLSRLEPDFKTPDGDPCGPLAQPRLSRRPIRWTPRPEGGLLLDASATGTRVTLSGEVVNGQCEISPEELAEGAVLVLATQVAVLLHNQLPSVVRPPAFGMVGESAPMLRLRREIERVADLSFPVLLRGASGTGKELVARAIQKAGPRRARPYLAVNVAAIPASLAASELFGAAKGAYSGADRRRRGYFQRADGGTLFLDEIGEMPPEVQVQMLRALESGEIQPVGSEVPQPVDVRVIAATDADLEQAIRDDRFKAPLLHRLASYEIELPPLRQRREDIGRLFFHFLRQELDELGEGERLASPGRTDPGRSRPFVSAELVGQLAAYDWPGNVRQLRNVVRQLAVASRGSETMVVGSRVERILASPFERGPNGETGFTSSDSALEDASPPARQAGPRQTRAAPGRAARRKYRDPDEVSDDELIAALRAHQYRLKPAAQTLGVSRASLYVLIDACPRIRKAADLDREEIEAAGERFGGRAEAMAEALEVSKQGLKMRMKELGLR